MLNTAELLIATEAVHCPTGSERTSESVLEYRETIQGLEAQWAEYLAATYLTATVPHTPAVLASIYRNAWEVGHSSGYQNVELHYQDFAELANIVAEDVFNTMG